MTAIDEGNQWFSEVSLDTVLSMFLKHGVEELLYKVLPRNANSKNQVYLAPDFAQLGKIPSGEVTAHESTSRKSGQVEAVFRAPLDLHWLVPTGQLTKAPHSKLIFYPQYPEVRFSGFLQGCRGAPSFLYDKSKRGKDAGRILIIGVRNDRRIIALTLPPEAPAAREIIESGPHDSYGALSILPMAGETVRSSFLALMSEICLLHRRHWIDSRRLDKSGVLVPCNSTNCGGYTLEAHLGIRSNGIAAPDFHGWEVKARTVKNVERPGRSVVTLFTPEPSGGIYVQQGFEHFIRAFGYPDTKGREDRINFGGIHRCTKPAHPRTGLRMVLDGYDVESGRFRPDGAIRLLDKNDADAASWSFAKLMDHWKIKHVQAAYVPCQQNLSPSRSYRYGTQVLIGEGAEFGLFLKAVAAGIIYYDPGINLEAASTARPRQKRRSQIRVSSHDLHALYESTRTVDACSPS